MTEEGTWQIIALESEDDGKLVYRMMIEKPTKIDCGQFTENVSVTWHFADEGLPSTEIGGVLRQFEGFVDSLDDLEGNSFLTFVFSGRGMREWSYYVKDYDKFMEMLNDALATKSPFPIEIEHSHDPDWEYWSGIKEHVAEE